MKHLIIFVILFESFFLGLSSSYAQTENQPKEMVPKKPRVGAIDPSEKERYRTRFEAKDSRFFAFGPGRGFNLNNNQILYNILSGYEWEVGSTGALPAELFLSFGERTFFGDASLGYKHFFSDEDFSFFVKGTMGAGTATIKDGETITGFTLKGSTGATFFRTSSKHLELMLTYATLMKDSVYGQPSIFAFTIAILY